MEEHIRKTVISFIREMTEAQSKTEAYLIFSLCVSASGIDRRDFSHKVWLYRREIESAAH